MKRIMAIATCIVALSANAQISGAGLQIKGQSSSQLHKIPNDFKYGRSGTGNLKSIGGDLYLDYSLGDKMKIRFKTGYEEKGFVTYSHFSTVESGSSKLKWDQGNFKFISTDLIINYYFGKQNIKPYALAGLSSSYLLNKKYTLNIDNTYSDVFIEEDFNEKYNDYSKFNIGAILGLGIDFKNIFWIETEFNPDLISPVRSENLKIKHHTFSVNAGINLLNLFNK